MALPIGIQLYSVRDAAKADLKGTLMQLKKMGYDGVQFAGLYDHSPEEVRDMCKDIGINPISAHVGYVNLSSDLEGVFTIYKTIGCKSIALPWLAPEYRPGGEKFSEVLALIERVGNLAKEMGIQFLYHNHYFEFEKIGDKYKLDMLYEQTDPELLQTEIDVCWVAVGGADPVEYINKYAGRSPVLHLKDYYGERSEETPAPKVPATFEYRPIGSGCLDFPAIIKAAEAAGTEWLIVEQDSPSKGLTPLECAKRSREYLKSIGY